MTVIKDSNKTIMKREQMEKEKNAILNMKFKRDKRKGSDGIN